MTIKPHGGSMSPLVISGAAVTLEPAAVAEMSPGDIVLCRVEQQVFLHLVKEVGVGDRSGQVLIGNNRGKLNGWTSVIFGRATQVLNPPMSPG